MKKLILVLAIYLSTPSQAWSDGALGVTRFDDRSDYIFEILSHIARHIVERKGEYREFKQQYITGQVIHGMAKACVESKQECESADLVPRLQQEAEDRFEDWEQCFKTAKESANHEAEIEACNYEATELDRWSDDYAARMKSK